MAPIQAFNLESLLLFDSTLTVAFLAIHRLVERRWTAPSRDGREGQGDEDLVMVRPVCQTDRKIIRLLQRNARASYAELSRETGIPESTVRRRMDRLMRLGVIEFAMLAEPSKLGYELRAMIGLKVELRRLEEIAETLRGMNEVTFAAFLTGNFDVMIHVVVRSQEALVEFLTQRLAPVEGVRSTETFVMPYIVKPTTSWILPEIEANDPVSEGTEGDDLTAEPEDLVVPVGALPTPSGRGRRGRPRRNAEAETAAR